MFMIVFGIHFIFLIDLPIRVKTCRSNVFLLFYKAKWGQPKYWARPARPIGIERAICPGLYYEIKVIPSYVIGIYIYFIYFQPDLFSAGPTMAMKEGKK